MKTTLNIALWIIILFLSIIMNAQDYQGSWLGSIQGMPLIFEISKTTDGYTTKMQSPKQSPQFLPMDNTTIVDGEITMKLAAYKISYTGKLENGKIMGTFSQGEGSGAMNLEQKKYVEVKPNRPQTPEAPFPYKTEDVTFKNPKASDITLAGTLTLPVDVVSPPVVILISGSGPQDRNEELFDHKPFLLIADHLTKNGIAVLRYDDRGVAKSEGTQKGATSVDFATDVVAAIAYLKTRNDIDPEKIGLIGHSEGGLIAPMVIADHPDNVAFFVSLAGPGVRGKEVLMPQMRKNNEFYIDSTADIDFEMNVMEAIFDEIIAQPNAADEYMKTAILTIVKEKVDNADSAVQSKFTQENIKSLANQFSDPWFRYFIAYDPTSNLEKVTCPVLALNGSLDYQVVPEINLPAMEAAFAKANNQDVTIKTIPGLNHLFQNATTGSGGEYAQIEETFDPETLTLISSWINARF